MVNKKLLAVGVVGAVGWYAWRVFSKPLESGNEFDGVGGFFGVALEVNNELGGLFMGNGINENLTPSIRYIAFLKDWENPRKIGRDSKTGLWFSHDDGAGNETIGYGHKVLATENFDKGLTDYEIDKLLAKDLAEHTKPVYQAVKKGLTQNQFDTLVDLAYNRGGTRFRKSQIVKYINENDFDAAGNSIFEGVINTPVNARQGVYNRRVAAQKIWFHGIYER